MAPRPRVSILVGRIGDRAIRLFSVNKWDRALNYVFFRKDVRSVLAPAPVLPFFTAPLHFNVCARVIFHLLFFLGA